MLAVLSGHLSVVEHLVEQGLMINEQFQVKHRNFYINVIDMPSLFCFRVYKQPCILPTERIMLQLQNFLFQKEQISTSKTGYALC